MAVIIIYFYTHLSAVFCNEKSTLLTQNIYRTDLARGGFKSTLSGRRLKKFVHHWNKRTTDMQRGSIACYAQLYTARLSVCLSVCHSSILCHKDAT